MEIEQIVDGLRAKLASLQRESALVQTAISGLEDAFGLSPAVSAVEMPQKVKPAKRDGKPVDAKTRKEKPCRKCGATKALSEYSINHACTDGHVGTCKQCERARAKAHKQKAPQPDPPSAPQSGLVCKLCYAPCSSKDRLDSHMRSVHPAVS